MRLFAVAIFCCLCAANASAATTEPAIQGPASLLLGPDQTSVVDAVADGPGALAVAFRTYSAGSYALNVGTYGPEGQSLVPAVQVYAGSAPPVWAHIATWVPGTQLVAWGLRTSAQVAAVRGGVLGPASLLSTGTLEARECKVAGAGAGAYLICTMGERSGVGVPEIYWYAFDATTGALDGPHLASADDGIASYTLAAAGSSDGGLWIALADWNPLTDATSAVQVVHVASPSGPSAFSNLTAPTGVGAVAMLLPRTEGGSFLALGTNRPTTNNALVAIWQLPADLSAPAAATMLSGASGTVSALGCLQNPQESSLELLWVEATPTSGSTGTVYWAALSSDLRVQANARPLSAELPVPILQSIDGGFIVSVAAPAQVVHLSPNFATAPPSTPAAAAASALLFVGLAVAAAAGAGGAFFAGGERLRYLFLLLLVPLYTNLRGERIMVDSMRRGAILQVINEAPGVRFSELSRRTGIKGGALTHHLRVLEEHGFVSHRGAQRVMMFYPLGKNPIEEDPFTEVRDRILREIRKSPGISHQVLCKRVAIKWSTGVYHVGILKAEGKVRARRDRGKRKYWPLE